MQLMERDRLLLNDLALHHLMTRVQITSLGYFPSASRASARLVKLQRAGLIRQVQPSPFIVSKEHLYVVAKGAMSVLDSRIARLLVARSFTPRFIDHALATVNLRCTLLRLGLEAWWAEPQIRHTYEVRIGSRSRVEDFRPDGLALIDGLYIFVEVDRGNTSLPRFIAKLSSYSAYLDRVLFAQTYPAEAFTLLVSATGHLRKRHLLAALPKSLRFPVFVTTESEVKQATSLAEVLR